MTSTLSNWYHNQYSTWNRTRRIQAAPYLARVETPASRATRAATGGGPAPGDAVINLGDLVSPLTSPNAQTGADKKKQDTLFGPSIGIVNPGPEWTDPNKIEQGEKAPIQDVLTPELVQSWVEKSKEASQPTTTLQALVNLKRPSLRLSPISKEESEEGALHAQHHGLEFQFDCDAPKCGISVQVVSAADAGTSSSLTDVYHTVVDGGFGRMLKFEDGAALELDKFDPSVLATSTSTQTQPPPEKSSDSATVAVGAPASNPAASPDNPQHKKRFKLRIRRRTNAHVSEDANFSVAGPALQVVDDEAPAEAAGSHDKSAKESGVKVLIKLEALDANEHSLASFNAQKTYLHVFRLGSTPAPDVPDTRAWVVRVVKREATIGFHTFHLHEIYGLSSHAPPSETPEHSYPPTAADADEPTTECLLCLSSPREVVLLPCRHLVACKECAINMIEYGAGGQLVHTEEAPAEPSMVALGETPGEGSGATRNTEGGAGAAEGAPLPSPVPPSRAAVPRRKRKAKGWFCPVCRQPYTSLLRISTTALRKPPLASVDVAQKTTAMATGAAAVTETPAPAAAAAIAAAAAQNTRSGPGFLRAITNAAARVTGSDNNNNNNSGAASNTVPTTGEAAV